MKKLLLAVLVAALLLLAFSATANAKTPTLKSLAKSVAALQKKASKQAKTIITLKSDLAAAKQTIAAQGQTLTSAAPLLACAPYVSLNTTTMNGVKGPHIVYTGVNVHIVSGSGSTIDGWGTPHGLGNLIVGYNERAGLEPRSGSHNIVGGAYNGFSSIGGLVVGFQNTISGSWATATGGVGNQATANCATVSGGYLNTASGTYSTVSGGQSVSASGSFVWAGGAYQTP